MEVELELERPAGAGYAGAPAYPHAARQPQGGEMEVEVELEDRGGTSQFGGSTADIDRRPQSPTGPSSRCWSRRRLLATIGGTGRPSLPATSVLHLATVRIQENQSTREPEAAPLAPLVLWFS